MSDSNQLACGMGHLDWTRILETLRATGYAGAIAVEFVPMIDRTPVNPNPGSIEDYLGQSASAKGSTPRWSSRAPTSSAP